MDIKQLIDTGENNVQIVVSVQDLKRFVLELLNDPNIIATVRKKRLVSLSEVADMLCTLPYRARTFLKRHDIKPVERIGSTTMYNSKDVEDAIYRD